MWLCKNGMGTFRHGARKAELACRIKYIVSACLLISKQSFYLEKQFYFDYLGTEVLEEL
jgi:hypothetical protein